MLAEDLAGRPYGKAEHNCARALQARISRSRASIEHKHQNIRVVLKGLGEVWIPGCKPASNFQMALEMLWRGGSHSIQPGSIVARC